MAGIKRHLAVLLVVLILFQAAACKGEESPTPQPATPFPALTETPQPPQVDALAQMGNDSARPLDLDFRNGFPTYVNGLFRVPGEDPIARAENFLKQYQVLYGLDNPDISLSVKRLAGEDRQNVVFFQLYKGIPVHGGELVVYQDREEITGTVGSLITESKLDIDPAIPAQKAEELLRQDLYLPENQTTSAETALLLYDVSLFGEGMPTLHLAWRVYFGGGDSWIGFVDAHDGTILEKAPRRHSVLHTIPFSIRDYTGFPRAADSDCYDVPILADYYIADDVYFDADYATHLDAVMGRQYIRDTYNFFKNTFGHRSFDGADLMDIPIILYVSWPGAWYYPECMVLEYSAGWVGDDVMTHEFTHGVLEATSGLYYSRQPGSLNESYCDIMGSLLDDDWIVGEDRTGFSNVLRDLSNPPAYGQPDHMSGLDISTSDAHHNNGIPNKVAYLIAEGGTHYGTSVTGIEEGKLGMLYYTVMTSLPSNADFMAARNATVLLAETWAASGTHGFTDFEVCQVRNAFHSVGLGLGDENCDGIPEYTLLEGTFYKDIMEALQGLDGDYIEPDIDNCIADFNLLQIDSDQDGIGDICDSDDDNDSIPDGEDNCRVTYNPDQADTDGDGVGDACEDNGILADPALVDSCRLDASPGQPDSDKDGIIDSCDNCPELSNKVQVDADGDSLGDACDEDDDSDGKADSEDNCPLARNPEQLDWDRDKIGAACDPEEYDSGLSMDLCGTFIVDEKTPTMIPLPSCLPDCMDHIEERFGLSIAASGLPSGAGVWVVNSLGTRISSADIRNGIHHLAFRPVGGEHYYLRFGWPDTILAGNLIDLCLELRAGILPEEEPGPSITFLEAANCRARPSSNHPILSSFQAGDQAHVLGRNINMTWYEVLSSDGQEVCWVWVKLVKFSGNLDDVPVRAPETVAAPVETAEETQEPTPTCDPKMNCANQ